VFPVFSSGDSLVRPDPRSSPAHDLAQCPTRPLFPKTAFSRFSYLSVADDCFHRLVVRSESRLTGFSPRQDRRAFNTRSDVEASTPCETSGLHIGDGIRDNRCKTESEAISSVPLNSQSRSDPVRPGCGSVPVHGLKVVLESHMDSFERILFCALAGQHTNQVPNSHTYNSRQSKTVPSSNRRHQPLPKTQVRKQVGSE